MLYTFGSLAFGANITAWASALLVLHYRQCEGPRLKDKRRNQTSTLFFYVRTIARKSDGEINLKAIDYETDWRACQRRTGGSGTHYHMVRTQTMHRPFQRLPSIPEKQHRHRLIDENFARPQKRFFHHSCTQPRRKAKFATAVKQYSYTNSLIFHRFSSTFVVLYSAVRKFSPVRYQS